MINIEVMYKHPMKIIENTQEIYKIYFSMEINEKLKPLISVRNYIKPLPK